MAGGQRELVHGGQTSRPAPRFERPSIGRLGGAEGCDDPDSPLVKDVNLPHAR